MDKSSQCGKPNNILSLWTGCKKSSQMVGFRHLVSCINLYWLVVLTHSKHGEWMQLDANKTTPLATSIQHHLNHLFSLLVSSSSDSSQKSIKISSSSENSSGASPPERSLWPQLWVPGSMSRPAVQCQAWGTPKLVKSKEHIKTWWITLLGFYLDFTNFYLFGGPDLLQDYLFCSNLFFSYSLGFL